MQDTTAIVKGTLENLAGGVDRAIARGLSWLEREQAETGAWRGDYGGPQFLLPLYVATCHANGVPLDSRTRSEMVRYIRTHQAEDGGWGLHIEGHSQVFTTSLNYVALRLLGEAPDDEALCRARDWLRRQGGPLASASWGKFFLALLNLYEYEGLVPVPPELWLLPQAAPIHPSRLWCHSRMVYLPMSWLYARRVKCELDDTLRALRTELYGQDYARIDWTAARHRVASTDAHVEPPAWARRVNGLLALHEKRPLSRLRARALDFVLEQIGHEDRNTEYLDIGPISKLLHVWVWQQAAPGGEQVRRHVEVMSRYLCEAPDGIKMNGYSSSQLWDTAFAVQAIAATGESAGHLPMLRAAHEFIDINQLREDFPERTRCFRDRTAGSWPFSEREQGWPVSDCTAEGLRSALLLAPHVERPIAPARLWQAADFILNMQNEDGGWPSYERARGAAWLEKLNPSNCFSNIMIDYSYVECTAACVAALQAYRPQSRGELRRRLDTACQRALSYLLAQQREDGSFEGSWGVCFTYGTWFGIHGLRVLGLGSDHPAVLRAVAFLEAHQRPDGSWGETAESNRLRRYVPSERGQPVMTAWALLGLLAAGRARTPEVERGVRWLVTSQTVSGEFSQERIVGMFNRTCAIHYANYPKIFPLWALADYRRALQS